MADIVAEISVNHGGYLERAIALINAAAECGCDYAKFQFYKPEDMPDRHEGNKLAMYNQVHVPESWLPALYKAAERANIGLFASAFSVPGVKALLQYPCPFIKFASPESTRLPRQTYLDMWDAIEKKRRVICSTADPHTWTPWSELVMFCPSGHPPTASEIQQYLYWFDSGQHFGFSDHTESGNYWTALDFIRRGARMIEKHFTIYEDCIDSAISARPATMKLLRKLAK